MSDSLPAPHSPPLPETKGVQFRNLDELLAYADSMRSAPADIARLNEFALQAADYLRSLPSENIGPAMKRLAVSLRRWGPQPAYNLLLRLEVLLGLRRPSVAIYDHTFQVIGGGQKYGCTIAHSLQDDFAVTLIANRPFSLEDQKRWYGLDLSRCGTKVVPLPFYEDGRWPAIDPEAAFTRPENPFVPISRESGNYDIFVNNSMLEMVCPLANVSLFVCHFPERRRSAHFYADRYDHLVHNSLYTAEWIRRKWKIEPTRHIYPPVDMEPPPGAAAKEKVILSVARFEVGGTKQQGRMVEAFRRLRQSHAAELNGWKLVLAGGSIARNPYLEKITEILAVEPDLPVELKVNISADELRRLYAQATIFWHFCGLYQEDPAQVEHFGMTIVEAMQNGCIPLVFDGGGQREIVVPGISGFRFRDLGEVQALTLRLIRQGELAAALAARARERGQRFTRERFVAEVRALFAEIMSAYAPAARS